MRKLDLQRELKKCVKDALFLMGIMKVGICSAPTQFDEDAGQPFCKRVSFDDWVHDIYAREYEEADFAGNHYVLTLDQVRNEKSFDKKVRAEVQPMHRTAYNEQGDPKASTTGPGMADMQDADLYDTVPLWDVWLPREKLVVTITADRGHTVADTSKVLRVVEWEGPETGPFHLLSYYTVPDNVLPVSPASLTFDNAVAFSALFNKVIRQAERQKDQRDLQRPDRRRREAVELGRRWRSDSGGQPERGHRGQAGRPGREESGVHRDPEKDALVPKRQPRPVGGDRGPVADGRDKIRCSTPTRR